MSSLIRGTIIATVAWLLIMSVTDSNAAEWRLTSFAEVGIGNNSNHFGCTAYCWDDQGEHGAFIALGKRLRYNIWYVDLHWTHISQWGAGWPVDARDESSVDHIGLKLGVEW